MIGTKNIVNQVICLFKGHKRMRKTVETETAVHKFSCGRCGYPLGMGIWKNIPPPPGGDEKEWELYKRMVIDNYLNR